LHHIILLQRLKFYKRLSVSTNYFMRDSFSKVFINNVQAKTDFAQIFHSRSELTVFVLKDFNCLCMSL
jgi:hypothetical protein